ncbi:MAG: hypothetical protein KDA89_24240, partial [Planctomycetaceae bacterium]|nr:hypothetical protein [Planctomycetaceae bacterium]
MHHRYCGVHFFSTFVFCLAFASVCSEALSQEGTLLRVTADSAPVRVTENDQTRQVAVIARGTMLWSREVQGEFRRVTD